MPYPSSATPNSAVGLTGNNQIDSLLAGSKWGGTTGSHASLTYSFFSPGKSYYSNNYSGDNEHQAAYTLTSQQETSICTALGKWSAVANIDLWQVNDSSSNAGDLRFAGYANMSADAAAWAYYPSNNPSGGDVWIGPYTADSSPTPGSYDFMTFTHEIGHALGLKHPFETKVGNDNTLPAAYDDIRYTVMSYTNNYDFEPTSPMLLDIAAMQYIYGKNDTWKTGNDIYRWDSNEKIFQTIWDAGGNDTIDASNQTRGVTLNINSGEFSNIGQDIYNYEKGILNNNYLTIAYGAIIENAIGSSFNDTLIGNGADNLLGGGAGADTLIGGLGNDTYGVDNAGDTIIEDADAGTDSVNVRIAIAGGSYTLSNNLENATLLNSFAFNLNGNALNNVLTGNDLSNVIDGGLGADSMNGGAGDDVYYVDNLGDSITDSVGTDYVRSSISYTLGATLENLALIGTDAINGTGNLLANRLNGALNSAANVLSGLAGNDTYVAGAGDTVIEGLNAGIDLVTANVSFELSDNVENLTLFGTDAINASGNALANILLGNDAANTLDGKAGIDTLQGGKGNDTYIVDLSASNTLQDSVSELLNEGTDTLVLRGGNTALALSTLTLAETLENLDASATGLTKLNLSGNVSNNVLTGNVGANVINGGAGNDTLSGMGGLDILTGGTGADTFSFNLIGNLGKELLGSIVDFSHAAGDKINLTAIANFTFMAEGAAVITDGAPTNQIYLDHGVLHGSMDGGHTAAFDIQLIGVTALTGSDFTAYT